MRMRKDYLAVIVHGILRGYGLEVAKLVHCPACGRGDYFIPETAQITQAKPSEEEWQAHQWHWDCLGCHARVSVFMLPGHGIRLITHVPIQRPVL